MILKNDLSTEELPTNSSTISLHNSSYGSITAMSQSYDGEHLFSVGLDGNIFSYKLKLPYFGDIYETMPMQFKKPLDTDDIHDVNFLSLEQKKQKDYKDERTRFVDEKKSQMLEVLAILKLDFAAIKTRNEALPPTQQLSNEELELDERITHDLQKDFERQMNSVRGRMAFDVEKSKLLKNKVENFLTNNLECWPIEVIGIRFEIY